MLVRLSPLLHQPSPRAFPTPTLLGHVLTLKTLVRELHSDIAAQEARRTDLGPVEATPMAWYLEE